MSRKWCIVVVMLAAAGSAAGQISTDDVQTITQFRVPEFDDQGKIKSQILGQYAEVLPHGVVRITELTLELFKDDKVDMRLTSPVCIYDKGKGGAASENSVKIERENMEVTGTGFLWDGRKETMQIYKDSRVVLTGARKRVITGDKE